MSHPSNCSKGIGVGTLASGGSGLFEVNARRLTRFPFGSVEAEHVHHAVDPWTLAAAPQGGLDGAAREDAAVGGVVLQLDDLAVGGEQDAVIAHHAAAAQRGKADVAAPARAGVAVAHAHARLVQ